MSRYERLAEFDRVFDMRGANASAVVTTGYYGTHLSLMNWNVHEGGCQDKLLRGHSLECLRFTHVFCPSNFLELKWEKISGTKGEKMELSQSRQVTINLCRKCMKCFQFHTCLDLRDIILTECLRTCQPQM